MNTVFCRGNPRTLFRLGLFLRPCLATVLRPKSPFNSAFAQAPSEGAAAAITADGNHSVQPRGEAGASAVLLTPDAGASLRHPVPMSKLMRMADKRLYLSCSRDGTVALWDVASLKPLRTLKATAASGLASWPMSVAHVPSLSSLVLGCGDRSLLAFECGSWDPKLFAPQGR